MSPEPLAALTKFLERAKHVTIVVAANRDDEEPLTIQRLNLHEDVANDFLKTAKEAVAESDDTSMKPYDPGYKPEPYELCTVSLGTESEVAKVIDDLSDVDSIELFEADDEVIDGLRFYAIVVSGSGNRAVFLRSYSPTKELSRRGGFALMMRAGTYNHIRSKVFLFDELVDCFTWGGNIYIRNVVQFQRIFRYFAQLLARADATLQQVARRIPISNLDAFRDACKANTLMAAKLAAIARKPYLNRVRMDDIKRAIKEFNLQIPTKIENGQEKLVFETSIKERWLILKLLDDDYLGSVMTREKYEVNSKTRV